MNKLFLPNYDLNMTLLGGQAFNFDFYEKENVYYGFTKDAVLKLKKEDGDWKVAFDAETLMKMGLDKIKTEGRKNGQQLDKQLESIQNMPLDSLKDEMQNSLQKLDSVQKTLDI